MTAKENEIQFTINLDADVLERLKNMAEYADLSRHKLILNLLKTGIEDVEKCEDVGIFQLALIIRNMTESKTKAKKRKLDEVNSPEMPIPLRIEKNYIERLERLAIRGDLSRQRLARNIINVGIDELETARKLKITDIFLKIRDLHDLFTNFLETGKQAFYAGKEV